MRYPSAASDILVLRFRSIQKASFQRYQTGDISLHHYGWHSLWRIIPAAPAEVLHEAQRTRQPASFTKAVNSSSMIARQD